MKIHPDGLLDKESPVISVGDDESDGSDTCFTTPLQDALDPLTVGETLVTSSSGTMTKKVNPCLIFGSVVDHLEVTGVRRNLFAATPDVTNDLELGEMDSVGHEKKDASRYGFRPYNSNPSTGYPFPIPPYTVPRLPGSPLPATPGS